MDIEPLTSDKISTFKDEIGDYHYFEIEDVKSAVEWFLGEIENLTDWDSNYQDYVISLNSVKHLIKEAFKGAIER